MSSIPYVPTGETLTFFARSGTHTIHKGHAHYDTVRSLLQGPDSAIDLDYLIGLTSPIKQIEFAAVAYQTPSGNSRITVENGQVRYHGEIVVGALADRMLNLLDEGWDLGPWFAFMENLYSNPSTFARTELYEWLEKSNLPITEDGHFLAFKRVNDNYTSVHDGRTDNTPGVVVQMPREDVDDDRRRHCSQGLHFCSEGYLRSFSGQRTVLLKVNPADVVSIPDDYDFTKGRAWRYRVIEDLTDSGIPAKWAAVHSGALSDQAATIAAELAAEAAAEHEAEVEALYAAVAEVHAAAVKAVTGRDYRAEYEARVARGIAAGKTRQRAAGHY